MEDQASRAEKYRVKAEECRITAESMTAIDCKQLLLRLAKDYERMAETVEKIATHNLQLDFKL